MCFENVKIIQSKKATDFVGVRIDGEKIDLYVPETFRYDKKNIKNSMPDVIRLLKSISLAKTTNKEVINTSDRFEVGTVWDIESYLWIINDYVDNGYYYSREKVYSTSGNGRIDWKKTLKKTPILLNNNIIYTDLVTSKVTASNTPITHVYKFCLDISLKRIGWVFNYNFKIEFEGIMSLKEMIFIVKRELSSTFDDLKRIRFKRMISILEGVNDNAILSKKHTYGVEHYYYVFEKMIDKMFGNISETKKKSYNPSTYWTIGIDSVHRNRSLKPDTIHNFKNAKRKITYIIDAKLYRYGYTANFNDLPGSQSIQKQITYGDYIKNSLEIGKNVLVRNIFMLPYNKEDNCFNIRDDVYYFGYATAEWLKKDEMQDYSFVFGYLIDFNYLLNQYSSNHSYINEIYENIEFLINSLKEKV